MLRTFALGGVRSLFLINDAGMLDLERMHWTPATPTERCDSGTGRGGGAHAMVPVPLAGTVAEMVFKRGAPMEWRDVLDGPDVPNFYRTMAQRTGVNSRS